MVYNDQQCITLSVFIHSGHFYSAPSSPLLLRGEMPVYVVVMQSSGSVVLLADNMSCNVTLHWNLVM